MSFLPLSQAFGNTQIQQIRLVATDMDGTLTQAGKFTPALLQAFVDLAAAGIAVLLVTGRSAGWVSGLKHYLAIAGAIAENGGVFYPGEQEAEILLTPISDLTQHRQALAEMFTQLQGEFPQLRESSDNRFRLTDWTFDVQGLTLDDIRRLGDRCQAQGWGFTYSNVQCHIKPDQQDKATGLLQVLQHAYPQYTPAQIITVGDSPNDESLFNDQLFPISVGVANSRAYADQLKHHPIYITQAAEGQGFCELVSQLTQSASTREAFPV